MFLRGSYAGCLWFCKDGGRHDLKADVILFAKDAVHDMDRLHLCRMSEHLTTIHVADGE